MRKLDAVAAGAVGVFESSPAKLTLVDDDFVASANGIERSVKPLRSTELPLRAELRMNASRRSQIGIDTGPGARLAIGQLSEGRRLEAPSHIDVNVETGRGVPGGPKNRVDTVERQLAAVVRICSPWCRTSHEKVVLRVETNVDRPHSTRQRPPWREPEARLGKGIAALDRVALIAF